MEKQRAKCWHNRSKFEQNTFSSQVGLIHIITPNASNAAVGGNDISTYVYVFTEYFLHSFSNLSIEFLVVL